MFDAMAQRYGKLPSELLRHADSFDFMILDVATTYQAYKQSQAEGKPIPKDLMNIEELQEHFNKVRNR